jgi:SAM-dependent methyltransferase
MKLKDLLRPYYRAAKNMMNSSKAKKAIVEHKTGLWQTDKWANSFVAGSDADHVVAAALMDKEVNEYFLSECIAGNKVLDIGCGHGIVSTFLAKHNMEVTAVDISEKLLAKLAQSIEGQNLFIEIKRGDAYNIPCPDNYFDIVVARMFLPHFPDWPKVLKEMTRVTKKSGKILVHFNSRENIELARKIKLKDCDFGSSDNIADTSTFNAEADQAELLKVSKQFGLELQGRVPVSFFLYNRILGMQLGTEAYNKYLTDIQERIKDKKVEEFVVWFDKEIISRCHPALSYLNIIKFKKK